MPRKTLIQKLAEKIVSAPQPARQARPRGPPRKLSKRLQPLVNPMAELLTRLLPKASKMPLNLNDFKLWLLGRKEFTEHPQLGRFAEARHNYGLERLLHHVHHSGMVALPFGIMRHAHAPELDEKIRAAWASRDETITVTAAMKRIARQYAISKKIVSKILKKHGEYTPKRRGTR